MERLSKYLTYAEGVKSPTAIRLGIDNSPNEEQLNNMKYVATEIFDPVREFVGGPLHASSFFRSKALNAAIGGSSTTSQHMKGQAIDIDADTFGHGSNKEIFKFIKNSLIYDQLIGEYPNIDGDFAWVHVSKVANNNRMEVLIKLKDQYIPYSQWRVGMI